MRQDVCCKIPSERHCQRRARQTAIRHGEDATCCKSSHESFATDSEPHCSTSSPIGDYIGPWRSQGSILPPVAAVTCVTFPNSASRPATIIAARGKRRGYRCRDAIVVANRSAQVLSLAGCTRVGTVARRATRMTTMTRVARLMPSDG